MLVRLGVVHPRIAVEHRYPPRVERPPGHRGGGVQFVEPHGQPHGGHPALGDAHVRRLQQPMRPRQQDTAYRSRHGRQGQAERLLKLALVRRHGHRPRQAGLGGGVGQPRVVVQQAGLVHAADRLERPLARSSCHGRQGGQRPMTYPNVPPELMYDSMASLAAARLASTACWLACTSRSSSSSSISPRTADHSAGRPGPASTARVGAICSTARTTICSTASDIVWPAHRPLRPGPG